MYELVLPLPPYWEAQLQRISFTLFAESGDLSAMQAPFWLSVARLPKKPTVPPPFKGFFRLIETVNRGGRLILRFEVECTRPGNAEKAAEAVQTAETDLGPLPKAPRTSLTEELLHLSRRRIKTAPCYAETVCDGENPPYVRLFR